MGVVATNTTEAANTLIISGCNGFLVKYGDKAGTIFQMEKYIENLNLYITHRKISREIIQTTKLIQASENLMKLFTNS
jgi:hypothetical protein